jgi:hypothetical protein
MFVDKANWGLDGVVDGRIGVQSPRIEVDWYLSGVSTNLVESSHDPNTHVVNAPLWNSTIQDALQRKPVSERSHLKRKSKSQRAMSLTIVRLVPQKLVPESKVASPGLEEDI